MKSQRLFDSFTLAAVTLLIDVVVVLGHNFRRTFTKTEHEVRGAFAAEFAKPFLARQFHGAILLCQMIR